MSLYYEDESVTLYHGDCLTEHREWLDADVLVTDPPYGTQLTSTKNGNAGGYGRASRAERKAALSRSERNGCMIANDETTETRDAALAAWGVRPVVVFGSPRMPDPPGDWEDRLVWNKLRPGMNGGPFRYMHESIYARGMIRTNNSTFSVFNIHPDQTDHIHAKPVALMTALMQTCPPGTIADPFAGSGSTLVAAKALGRRAFGVELDEHYCEIAARRLSQGALDLGGL